MGKNIGDSKYIEKCWVNYERTPMEIEVLTEKLKDYRYEVLNLKRVNGKIKSIRELTQTPSSTKYDGVKTASKQTLNDKIANLVDLEFAFINKSADIEIELLKIEQAIDKLPTKQGLVLKYFYLDGLSINRISKIMNYEESNIYIIKREAIKELSELL